MFDYWVYILRCADSTYYTGITNDHLTRLWQHQVGVNPSCYTYKRRPVKLVYLAHFNKVMDAISWEKQVKRWGRKKKEALIQGDQRALEEAAHCFNGSNSALYKNIACHTERRRSATRKLLHGIVSIPRLRSG